MEEWASSSTERQPKWSNLILVHIKLGSGLNEISSVGLRFFLTASLDNLKVLLLGGNELDQRGIEYLTKADIPQLQ